MGLAKADLFVPLWSPRILEEWARAVAKNLPDQAEVARMEIALLEANWPNSTVTLDEPPIADLWLPDENDIHVLEAGIIGKADIILTANSSDFPTRILARHNILRRDPDGFIFGLWQDDPSVVAEICNNVRTKAEAISGEPQAMRPLLKKARLPRLGKALTTNSGSGPRSL